MTARPDQTSDEMLDDLLYEYRQLIRQEEGRTVTNGERFAVEDKFKALLVSSTQDVNKTTPSLNKSEADVKQPAGELRELTTHFVNRLPIKATEIGWEKVGEDQQDFEAEIEQLIDRRLSALVDELEADGPKDMTPEDALALGWIDDEYRAYNQSSAQWRAVLAKAKERLKGGAGK